MLKLSTLVPEQLPATIVADYERFAGSDYSKLTDFFRAYYDWLEEEKILYKISLLGQSIVYNNSSRVFLSENDVIFQEGTNAFARAISFENNSLLTAIPLSLNSFETNSNDLVVCSSFTLEGKEVTGTFIFDEIVSQDTSNGTARVVFHDTTNKILHVRNPEGNFISGNGYALSGISASVSGIETIKITKSRAAAITSVDIKAAARKVLTSLKDYHDIDSTIELFIKYFEKEFIANLPKQILSDKKSLIKHAKEFYRSKGSESSFRLLFRILFDKEVEFFYPSSKILAASDGVWTIDRSLRTEVVAPATEIEFLNNVNGRKIKGSISNASAFVEDSLRYGVGTYSVVELLLNPDSISGNFISNEHVLVYDAENNPIYVNNSSEILTANVGSVFLGLEITDGGRNYNEEEVIYIDDSLGIDGAGIIHRVSAGSIDEILIIANSAGTNYQTGERIEFINRYFKLSGLTGSTISENNTIYGSQSSASATIKKWDSNSLELWVDNVIGTFVQNEYLTNSNGIYLARCSALKNVGGFGADAFLEKASALNGEVVAFKIEDGGKNYKKAPAAIVKSNTGSGAILYVSGANIGSVQTINVFSPGYGSALGFGYGFSANGNIAFSTMISPDLSPSEPTFLSISPNGISYGMELLSNVHVPLGNTYSNLTIQQINDWHTGNVYSFDYTARANVNVGALCSHQGYYLNTKGHLSSDQKIYDGFFYQQYSYVLKISETMDAWEGAVKKLLHPAGTIVFGKAVFEYETEGGAISVGNVETKLILTEYGDADLATSTINANTAVFLLENEATFLTINPQGTRPYGEMIFSNIFLSSQTYADATIEFLIDNSSNTTMLSDAII